MEEVVIGGVLAIAGGVLATVVGVTADARRQVRSLADQRRTHLRDVYLQVVRSARRSREASVRCAALDSTLSPGERQAARELAEHAHDEFIEAYHHLYLVAADDEMWVRSRELRRVLDDMLDAAVTGDVERAQRDVKPARRARQNLANAVRIALGYERLQAPKKLPKEFTVGA